jgi:PAP2 superfamily
MNLAWDNRIAKLKTTLRATPKSPIVHSLGIGTFFVLMAIWGLSFESVLLAQEASIFKAIPEVNAEGETPSKTLTTEFETHINGQLLLSELDSTIPDRISKPLFTRLWDDQRNFYSPESATLLGGGMIVGGLMANSSFDDTVHRHFQSSVRSATSDDWFHSLHASKELGNGLYTLPIFASAWGAGALFPDSPMAVNSGRWGERSIRGFMVGVPPLIVLQRLTGGSRPYETEENSKWHPLVDNNGISGHAFMGSLPFITAAKMTENRAYKALLYAGSTIVPLSRVNDNAHYPSQVALGWWMAFLAASAIDATENPQSKWHFLPYSTADGSGLLLEYRF